MPGTSGKVLGIEPPQPVERGGGERLAVDVANRAGKVADLAVAIEQPRLFLTRRVHNEEASSENSSLRQSVNPPSITWIAPVVNADSSEAR